MQYKKISARGGSVFGGKNNPDKLFNPQSIVIVGASNKKGKIGTILADNILKLGYRGKLYFVNPSYKLLKLKRCYADVASIGKSVDLAIVAVPAKFVLDVVKESAPFVKNFIIISAGFGEIGAEGVKREQELAKLAQKHGLNILGPNCLGFLAPRAKLNASFASGMPPRGNVAFVSQSGALAVALMDMAKQEQLGFSYVISVGNKMQLDEAELLEFLARDKETKVIGMYLEGIKDGAKFIAAAQKVSKLKPIVILKAGKTEKAQHAISSHTGALAGSDAIMDVAFARAGVIRANDLEEFVNFLGFASLSELPKNQEMVVITNAGGVGVLTTDAFADKHVTLAEFSAKQKTSLQQHLPPEASVENPVDLLGDAQEDRYADVLQEVGRQNYGAVLAVLTPQDQTPVLKVAKTLIELKGQVRPVLTAVFVGGQKVKHEIEELKKAGIYNFATPELAVRTLDVFFAWQEKRKEKIVNARLVSSREKQKKAQMIVQKALKQKRKALLFMEAAKLFELYGVSAPATFVAAAKLPTNVQFPVVVKVDSDTVLHKSDKQGVILNVKDDQELQAAVANIRANFPGEQIIVQRMHARQTELILGLKRDPIFGTVVVAGLGGIYAEVLKAVDFYLAPMSRKEIENKLLTSKIGFLFAGARGQAKYDLAELAGIIEALMVLAKDVREIREVDVNPLFVYNSGTPAVAADIKIVF